MLSFHIDYNQNDVLLNQSMDSETNKPYFYCCECGNEIKEEIEVFK